MDQYLYRLKSELPRLRTVIYTVLRQNVCVLSDLTLVGYEPLPARPFLGIDYRIFYPNLAQLEWRVVRLNGFTGLFAAILEDLLTCYIFNSVYDWTVKKLTAAWWKKNRVLFMYGADVRAYNRRIVWYHRLATALGTIFNHPVTVILLRKRMQLIGGETVYNLPLSAMREIYVKEGLLGFFSGLLPRLLLIFTQVAVRRLAIFTIHLPKSWLYCITTPLSAAARIMMVQGAELQLVKSVVPSAYPTWMHCLLDLAVTNRLFRGIPLQYIIGVLDEIIEW